MNAPVIEIVCASWRIGVAPPLLFDPLDPELPKQTREAQQFKANRSLRDVEPTVNLWLRNPEGAPVEEDAP